MYRLPAALLPVLALGCDPHVVKAFESVEGELYDPAAVSNTGGDSGEPSNTLPEGALEADFTYGGITVDGFDCRAPWAVEGQITEVSCPYCDFTFDGAFQVIYTLDPDYEVPEDCSWSPIGRMLSYYDYFTPSLNNYFNIWGFIDRYGYKQFVMGSNYTYGYYGYDSGTSYFTYRFVGTVESDPLTGRFSFSIPLGYYRDYTDYYYYGYVVDSDAADAPPPPDAAYFFFEAEGQANSP